MHTFNYPKVVYEGKTVSDLKDEFLHGWCHLLQYRLIHELPGAEPYEIWEKTDETDGEFWNNHQIVKYKGLFIDISGIFTEEEMKRKHTLLSDSDIIELKLEPCAGISADEYSQYTGLPTHCCDVVLKVILDDIKRMNSSFLLTSIAEQR